MKHIIPLCALLLAGCANEKEIGSVTGDNRILLGVDGLGSRESSRAPVDKWEDTPVSIAYVYAPATVFDRSITVSVTDDSGEHINTGMEYPIGGTAVSFIGYHPVATPSDMGDVNYDISKGDTDVMMSNKVSGTLSVPISSSDKLVFEHLLTRVTFLMICKQGESYPEPVNGISVNANSLYTTDKLMTYVTLDLNSGTEIFKIPGTVFHGDAEGVQIPVDMGAGDAKPLVFDVMLQPGIPLDFRVVTLTDVKQITIDNDPADLWKDLTETYGGDAGKQYTVKLEFSGEGLIGAKGITVAPWDGGSTVHSGGTWW